MHVHSYLLLLYSVIFIFACLPCQLCGCLFYVSSRIYVAMPAADLRFSIVSRAPEIVVLRLSKDLWMMPPGVD